MRMLKNRHRPPRSQTQLFTRRLLGEVKTGVTRATEHAKSGRRRNTLACNYIFKKPTFHMNKFMSSGSKVPRQQSSPPLTQTLHLFTCATVRQVSESNTHAGALRAQCSPEAASRCSST